MYTKAIKGNSQFKKKSIYRKLTLAHVPNKQFVHWSYKQESEIHNDENNGFSTHSSWAHSSKQLKCKYYVNFFYSLHRLS